MSIILGNINKTLCKLLIPQIIRSSVFKVGQLIQITKTMAARERFRLTKEIEESMAAMKRYRLSRTLEDSMAVGEEYQLTQSWWIAWLQERDTDRHWKMAWLPGRGTDTGNDHHAFNTVSTHCTTNI